VIGFLLALALVIGCPSVGRANERAPIAVAMCVEAIAAAPRAVVRRCDIAPQPACVERLHAPRTLRRCLDLRCGGLPQPRAPDAPSALRRLG
jgi:hypothetical protein